MNDRQPQAAFYDRQVQTVADKLRLLADEVERQGRPRDDAGVMGVPRYTNAAEQVLHALAWGIPHLNAHYLVSAAALADIEEQEDKQ